MEGKYYAMSDNMDKILNSSSPEQKNFAVEAMDHYIQQYEDAAKKHEPKRVAYTFGEMISEQIRRSKPPEGERVTCFKGCSACCHVNVDISKEEALLLLEYAEEKKISIDWQRLEKQKDYTFDTYFNIPVSDRACVFLKDNKCQVYEYRPFNCRKMYSLDDPKKCDLDNGKQVIKRFVSPMAEVIACSVMTAAECGSMASLLLKYKNIGS